MPISNGLAEPNVKVVGPDGILLPASTYIFDNGTGIGELNLGEKDPVGICRITVDRPDTFKWRIRRTGKVMPFHPEKITLGIMYTAPPKLVQDIREGALTTRRTYFFVPEHTKTFSIRVSYQKDGWQAISLIRPDGTVTEHKGYTLEVKPKPEECGKVWGVRAKEPYNELMNIQTRTTVRPTFLKLHGVPPFVAARPAMLFVPDEKVRTAPEPEWDVTNSFPEGRYGKAVSVMGWRNRVEIPTGQEVASPNVREHYDARQATIEFFVRLPRGTTAGGYGPALFHISGKNPGASLWLMMYTKMWAVQFAKRDGKTDWLYTFGANLALPIAKGREWHHVAIQWNCNDNGRVMRRLYLNGYPLAHGDSAGSFGWPKYWPLAGRPAPAGDWLYLGGNHLMDVLPAHFDELRISDIPRYPFMQGYPVRPGGTKAFDPPAEPFKVDEHTLALFHFDGNAEGVDKNGKKIKAVYRSSPPTLQ